MFFIGIISNKDYSKIETELYKKLDKNEFTIINITNDTINAIKNIKYDVILIVDVNSILPENNDILKQIINNSKYLVINTDIEYDLEILNDLEINVITYGFNSKTTITASSIGTDNLLVCIQRNIINIYGKIIEQQDKKVDITGKYNANYMLGIVAILIIFEKI